MVLALLLSACNASAPIDPQAAGGRPAEGALENGATVECLFDRREEGWPSIDLAAGCAVDPTDRFFVASASGILEAGEWTDSFDGVPTGVSSFAFDATGTLHVVCGAELGRIARGGTWESTVTLPGPGFRVVPTTGTRVFLFGPARPDATAIFSLEGPASGPMTVQQVGNLAGVISAAVAIGDELLFAAGRDLFRMGPENANEWLVLKVARAPCEAIESLAFDSERAALYVATTTSTMLYRKDTFVPLLAFGGELALGGEAMDRLYVYQSAAGRAFKVDLPQLIDELSARS
jgi:hypothetical protein